MLEFQSYSVEWLGGLFDGEGCVCIEHNKKGSYRLKVSISQYNPPVLEFLQKKLGGCLRGNHGIQLTLGDAQAEAFLRLIRPYVIIKAEVIDLALRHRELMATHYKQKQTVATRQIHETLRRAISALNQAN